MHIKRSFIYLLLVFLSAPLLAEDREITIDVIEQESGVPEQLMNRIELPDEAVIDAREPARSGLEIANEAREKGQRQGAETAAEVRDVINLGREIPLPPELENIDLPQRGPIVPPPPSLPGGTE